MLSLLILFPSHPFFFSTLILLPFFLSSTLTCSLLSPFLFSTFLPFPSSLYFTFLCLLLTLSPHPFPSPFPLTLSPHPFPSPFPLTLLYHPFFPLFPSSLLPSPSLPLPSLNTHTPYNILPSLPSLPRSSPKPSFPLFSSPLPSLPPWPYFILMIVNILRQHLNSCN